MIRRHPQRPSRRQHQDFHFFAAGDPTANIESQFARPAPAQPAPPPPPPSPTDAAIEPNPPNSQSHSPATGQAEPKTPAPASPVAASNSSAKSGPPYILDIVVPPERRPALERQLGAALRHVQNENDPDDDVDFEGAADLDRAIKSFEKIRAAVAIGKSEPPAIEELHAIERKRKHGRPRARQRPTSKACARNSPQSLKSDARLATARQVRSRKARLPIASQARASHETQCTVCTHRYRAEIENEFMHWHTIGHIAYDYKVSRSAIYRHAYALGLFSQRNRLLRFSLGHLIDRVQDVEPTADSIVRAVHLFARINDEGECIEPPAHVIVSSGGVHREALAPRGHRPLAIQLDSPALIGKIADPSSEAGHGGWPNGMPLEEDDAHEARKGGTVNRP